MIDLAHYLSAQPLVHTSATATATATATAWEPGAWTGQLTPHASRLTHAMGTAPLRRYAATPPHYKANNGTRCFDNAIARLL